MKKRYEKEVIIEDLTQVEKNKQLIHNIVKTQKNINIASINYEYADGKLIDYYLYTLKAEQAKLDYLVEKAKKNGIKI